MTKSERLMQHLQLMRTKRVVSIEQLCAASGVSPRTIYRDIISLTKMNVPIYYDNGYRLERDPSLPLREFNADDLELLCFCLRNNPLAEYEFFARRFRLLEQKVAEKLNRHSTTTQRALFSADDDLTIQVKASESNTLKRFMRAVQTCVKVEIIRTSGSPRRSFWYPVGVTMRADQLSLVVVDRAIARPTEIPLSAIKHVRITGIQFDSGLLNRIKGAMNTAKKELTALAG